jgi:hypothetical protein
MTLAGLAAGTALVDVTTPGPFGFFAQDPAAPAFPEEILNPIEVSGAVAEPTFGRLPGERRMYVMNITQGEHHLIGSQVMSRVARPVRPAEYTS